MPALSRKHFFGSLCICVLALGYVEEVRSDFVIYRLPGTKLVAYYQKCSQFEDDLSAESRIKVFTELFGDLQSLEQEFRGFMITLKSDVDRLREAAK